MRNKGKGSIKKIVYSALIIYVGYILIRQQICLFDCQKQAKYYKDEIEKGKEISIELNEKQNIYKSDVFIEKTARDKLGMVYPGELIFKDISQ